MTTNRNNRKLKIGIVGLGMVGSPLRRWFQEKLGYRRGSELFCYDADVKRGFTDDVNRADVIFVAVPTPSGVDGSCDISILKSVVKHIKNGKVIVVKSTVAPGTVYELQKRYPKKRLIFNPEFLTEAQVWEDFLSPDRQIVAHTDKSLHDTVEVLQLLPKKHFIRPWTTDYAKRSLNSTEAELAKYASNVFGYVKVVFGNVLADVCHALNLKYRNGRSEPHVSYENLRETLGADLRIGSAWLNVEHGDYCGVGGYCFPKDMAAFIVFAERLADELVKRRGVDGKFMAVFRRGIGILKAVHAYNQELLKLQGLTLNEVSRHDQDIIVKKRKKIRQ